MPIDGRKHDERNTRVSTYHGHTVGRWDGDTLVLDSIASTTYALRAAASSIPTRCTWWSASRVRAMKSYEVTVEDPVVLVEPWVMTPRILRLTNNADAGLLPERGNCEVSYEKEARDADSALRRRRKPINAQPSNSQLPMLALEVGSFCLRDGRRIIAESN